MYEHLICSSQQWPGLQKEGVVYIALTRSYQNWFQPKKSSNKYFTNLYLLLYAWNTKMNLYKAFRLWIFSLYGFVENEICKIGILDILAIQYHNILHDLECEFFFLDNNKRNWTE